MEPSTNRCPLLPGQTVNVLDVPVQGDEFFGGSRNVSSSSLDSAVFTLNPKAKYLPLGFHRATVTSAVHSRKTRSASTPRPELGPPHNRSVGTDLALAPQNSKTSQDVLAQERQRSLFSVFHRMRPTRSVGSDSRRRLAWPRKIFSRAGQSTKKDAPEHVAELAKLPDRAPSLPPTRIGDVLETAIQASSAASNTNRALTAFMTNVARPQTSVGPSEQLSSSDRSKSALQNEREQGLGERHATFSDRDSETSFTSNHHIPLEQLWNTHSYFAPPSADHRNDVALSDSLDRLNLARIAPATSTNSIRMTLDGPMMVPEAVASAEALGSPELDFHSRKYSSADSLASYATSANFSPCLASHTNHSGPTSPYHLSQPETPIISEFEDEALPPLLDSEPLDQMGKSTSSDLGLLSARPPSSSAAPRQWTWPLESHTQKSYAKMDGFQNYSLPDHDHASALTIRKLPSITFKTRDDASPFAQTGCNQGLVHSWNDGSEHRMTALGELFDDLGYLGELII